MRQRSAVITEYVATTAQFPQPSLVKKVLVTGDRAWCDDETIVEELKQFKEGTVIIHGACRGADSACASVASTLGFEVRAYPADWETHGRAAGPTRNQQMLDVEHVPDEPIDCCLVFHPDISKSKGTADMVRRVTKACIPWKLVQPWQREQELSTRPVIDSFRGDFGFLSNFYEASVWLDGERYRSVEHAYQASKTTDEATKALIRDAKTPGIAKRLGYSCQLSPDWDARKVDVMRRLIREKFKNPLLRALLVATEDAELVEGNTWNDTTWGVCRGVGKNLLGKILMDVREECRQEEKT